MYHVNLCFWFLTIKLLSLCTNMVNGNDPNIHELSYDYSLKKIDPSRVHTISGMYDTTTVYQIKSDPSRFNVTIKYFLSKPWRLRRSESGSYTRDVRIEHPSRIIFQRVKLKHQGVYSLYIFHFEKLIQSNPHGQLPANPRPFSFNQNLAEHDQEDFFDLNQIQQQQQQQSSQTNYPRLLKFTRHDFMLKVNGLKQEGETCLNDYDCESGSCPSFRCVCNGYVPVFLEQSKICVHPKNLNETCMDDAECQYYGGEDSECRRTQCLCKKFTFPIKITTIWKQCVRLADINEPCIYSKQCSFVGENRFCNGSYRCDCLPGYRLDPKYNKCVPTAATSSSSSSYSLMFFLETYPILLFLLLLLLQTH